ncbi:right-handed parallel beta-helix repeat-containing protein [Candidatus Poribacteria bacterium]|nr:right-handed parallel beta-helix repeat-containing protein [Candidatus Poribacteria bacterium]
MIQNGIVGEVVFVKGNNVYVDQTTKLEVKKDDILSIFKDDDVLGKIKILNVNPLAPSTEIYAVIMTEEAIPKIQKGDVIFSPRVVNVSSGLDATGDGTNSFLNMLNDKSALCISCHKDKENIIKTKHDLTINFPGFTNIAGEKTLSSGVCSSCHTAHNTNPLYLSSNNYPAFKDRIDNISKICKVCHDQTGIAKNKIPNRHHPLTLFPPTVQTLVPPPTFMPLYDIEGNIGFWDYVSCATCHDAHQWDPENKEKRDTGEGDADNSFLRIKNSEEDLCDACHLNKMKLIMANEAVKSNETVDIKAAAQEEVKRKFETISIGGPSLIINYPKNKTILSNYEEIISGTIDDKSVNRCLVLINGKPFVISVTEGNFSEKVIFNEGKNIVRILATNSEGKSGSSEEINVFVDSRSTMVKSYDYPKPVVLMDNFQIKIVFNQSMDINSIPFIYLLTGNKESIVLENQISTKAKFFSRVEPPQPAFEPQVINEMKQGVILLNAIKYYGYENKPLIAIKDSSKNKKSGPKNDKITIKASSPLEPKGELFNFMESDTPGIFIGEVEFGRWEEYGDGLIAVEDDSEFVIAYNLAEYTTTDNPDDTLVTTPIKITKAMKGTVRIVVENALGLNGNVLGRDDSESFIVNPDLFYIKNKNPITIQEGETIRVPNINFIFSVDEATEMIISEKADFSLGKWESFKEKKELTISNQPGMKTIYFKFKNRFNAESPVLTSRINYIPIEYKTELNNDIKQNTTLTSFMGPFLIRKSIKVEPGAALTIKPGTKFWIDSSAKEKIKITILGKIEAEGNEDEKIVFTSNSSKPKPGDWDGIEIINSQKNSFKYVNIEYAEQGISFSGSSGEIQYSRFENNSASGLECKNNSNFSVSLNEFRSNKLGINIINCSSLEITNNFIIYNETGINCENISSPKIINNTITKNAFAGIKCTSMSSPPISDNDISQNIEHGIYISKASPMIYHNNIIENIIGIYCEIFNTPFLIKENNLYSNKDYAIKLSRFDQVLDLSKNWWGVRNTDIINKIVYDYNEDNSLGKSIILPILETPINLKNLNISIDKDKPYLLTCEYQNPANLTNYFQISFVFNEPINPYVIPTVTLVPNNDASKSIQVQPGKFSFVKIENDTYITPNISLDESLSGEIAIYIENAQDLTGNIFDKKLAGKFTFNPTLTIKEGEYISISDITLLIKNPKDISEQDKSSLTMIIGEDQNFTNLAWQPFSNEKKLHLSDGEGKKTIYFRTRNKNGVLSSISQYIVNLDKKPPRILNPVYNVPKVNELFNLKIYFSEPLNPSIKPKVTLRSINKNSFELSEGTITTTNLLNDTYTLSPTALPENIEGYITIVVENVKDIAGNEMNPTSMNNLFRYDIVPPSPLVKIEGGNYTSKNDIILIFEEQKDRKGVEYIMSEDKDLKNTKWEELKNEQSFHLSDGVGEKNIYLQFRDKVGYISTVQKVTVILDKSPPYVIAYDYPIPHTCDDFQVKLKFDGSLDSTYTPEFSLVGTGEKNPIIKGKGYLTTTKFPNDTYVSPLITLDQKMGGALTIIISKAHDLAKNEMKLDMSKSFNFDTYAPITSDILVKEGLHLRNPNINFVITVAGAVNMMISEDTEFKDAKWEKYATERPFILSNQDGVKKVYFKFEDENKNASEPKRVEITLDRAKPAVAAVDVPKTIELNKPFKVTLHFNEEIKPERPSIVLMSSNFNYLVVNEGTFVSDKNKNDTYITPDIVFDDSMKGAIVIVADQVFDPTGNKMDIFDKLLFFMGQDDPKNIKIKLKDGEYTSRPDILLLLNYTDVKEVKVSEDKNNGKWMSYKEKIRYVLSDSEGVKHLYVSLRHNDAKIENVEFKVFLDKTPPVIKKYLFPDDDIQLVKKIKFIFNESLNVNYPPSIVIADKNNNSILLTEGGEFTTTSQKNDTYITPFIKKYDELMFPITISITKIKDLSGNTMGLMNIKKYRK